MQTSLEAFPTHNLFILLSKVLVSLFSPATLTTTDVDWASDLSTRSSTSGNVFLIGNNPISWFSKRQTASQSLPANQNSSLQPKQHKKTSGRHFSWKDLSLEQLRPIIQFEYNKSCIILVRTPKSDSRIKHIDVKYHLYLNGTIQLEYRESKSNLEDMHTGALPKSHFQNLRETLNIL
ncbi:hypothetical protein NPIL_358241 [Nephila pilipes]|uniref:Uncharacterized protein n=1 Tax=Nephila pilipes TaxID=299642 RepID=A0A8X6PSF3_NEPPI|nr:hypothetical protein NPIL_358241 [Nephila pilipes]